MRTHPLRFAPLLLLAVVPACSSSDDASAPGTGGPANDASSDTSTADQLAETGPDVSSDATDGGDDAIDAATDATDGGTDAADETPVVADASDEDAVAADAPDDTAPEADPADASPFTALASGQSNPVQLVTGGGWVYWRNQGGSAIGAVPAAGGAEADVSSPSSPTYVWADATNLYWAGSDGDFWARPHGGGSPTKLCNVSNPQVEGMATDGTYLYWVKSGDGYVRRAPIDGSGAGSAPEAVGSSVTSPSGVTIANGTVYLSEGWGAGGIDKVVGATTSPLVSGSSLYNTNPAKIINDGTYLYWIESPFGSSSIEGCKLDGTGLTRYVGSASVVSIAADGSSFYYANGSPQLTIVRFVAGDRFSGQTLYDHLPYESYTLAVDATSLYWADYTNGVIYKAPK